MLSSARRLLPCKEVPCRVPQTLGRKCTHPGSTYRHCRRGVTPGAVGNVDGVQSTSAASASGVSDSPESASADHQAAPSKQDSVAAVLTEASFIRKFVTCNDKDAVAELLSATLDEAGLDPDLSLSQAQANQLLAISMARSNFALTRSIYDALCCSADANSETESGSCRWPAAGLETVVVVVEGLARSLQVEQALAVVESLQSRGMRPGHDAVGFGTIINCPLAPGQPLAVVQPQEGSSVVACSKTRYEYELFSGSVVSTSSQAVNVDSNPLLALARMVGLWKKGPVAAVHEMVVQSPGGASKTFRFATESKDVPAQEGDRVTTVLSPDTNSKTSDRVLSTRPPRTQPGQAMQVTNHTSGISVAVQRPPAGSAEGALPGWVVPAAVVLTSGDAASYLVSPTLPALIAGGAVAAAGSYVAGSQLIIPEMKRLPERSVQGEAVRQDLLRSHSVLFGKVQEVTEEARGCVRDLARLHQLQDKMEAVGGKGEYKERIQRVGAARKCLSRRLRGVLELLDGFSTVMKRIEIEVEMDVQVPEAEMSSIASQIERLTDLESLQGQWKLEAEARDEVEKLLRN